VTVNGGCLSFRQNPFDSLREVDYILYTNGIPIKERVSLTVPHPQERDD